MNKVFFIAILSIPTLALAQSFQAVDGKLSVTREVTSTINPDEITNQCQVLSAQKDLYKKRLDECVEMYKSDADYYAKNTDDCNTVMNQVNSFINGNSNAMSGINWTNLDSLTNKI